MEKKFVMYFVTDVKKYGSLNKAVIMNQITSWVEYNKKNEKNLHDGKYWCYNTLENWEELTGISSTSLHRALTGLVEDGFLIKSNYNKLKFDRTGWYTIGQNENSILQNENSIFHNEKSILQNENSEPDKMENGTGQNEMTIPDTLLNNLNTPLDTPLHTSLDTRKNKVKVFGVEIDLEEAEKDLDYNKEFTNVKNNTEDIWNTTEL